MKVTQAKDCTTYNGKKACVEDTNCVWNTKCAFNLSLVPNGGSGVGGTINTNGSISPTPTSGYTGYTSVNNIK